MLPQEANRRAMTSRGSSDVSQGERLSEQRRSDYKQICSTLVLDQSRDLSFLDQMQHCS